MPLVTPLLASPQRALAGRGFLPHPSEFPASNWPVGFYPISRTGQADLALLCDPLNGTDRRRVSLKLLEFDKHLGLREESRPVIRRFVLNPNRSQKNQRTTRYAN